MPAKKRKCRARRAKAVPVKIFIGGIYAVGVPSIIMVAIGSVMYYLMNKICHAVRILLMDAGILLMQLISDLLLRFFVDDETVIALGCTALRIISLSFIFAGFCIVIGSVLHWFGESRPVFHVTRCTKRREERNLSKLRFSTRRKNRVSIFGNAGQEKGVRQFAEFTRFFVLS